MNIGRWLSSFGRRHCYLVIWFVLTLGMGLAYKCVWSFRPDYFRVQSDLNLRPIDLAARVRGYSAFDDQPLPGLPHPDIESAASRLQMAYEEAQLASGLLAADQRALRTQARTVSAGDDAFEASQWAQVDEYVRSRTAPFDRPISELQSTMAGMLRVMGVRSPDQLPEGPVAVDYADTRVRLAEQSLGRINAKAAAQHYALHHLEEFQRTPQQREHLLRRRELLALRRTIEARQGTVSRLASRVIQEEEAYRRVASTRLTVGDFLYFSIGGATGANFGDISPNHTLVRLLYSGQILLSILLLALALESITKRNAGAPSPGLGE